jgi:hypothetical protein
MLFNFNNIAFNHFQCQLTDYIEISLNLKLESFRLERVRPEPNTSKYFSRIFFFIFNSKMFLA